MKKIKLLSLAIIFLSFFFISSGIKNNQIKQCPCIKATSGNNDKISPDCTFNGFKLYGKIKFVEHFPDIKIQIVEHFPDLKVQLVEHFPDKCGKWQIVEHFPDIKIQIVEHFPDIKVKYVEHFPGIP